MSPCNRDIGRSNTGHCMNVRVVLYGLGHSSSNLEIIVADLGVPPRLAGWPGGRGVSKNNDREA